MVPLNLIFSNEKFFQIGKRELQEYWVWIPSWIHWLFIRDYYPLWFLFPIYLEKIRKNSIANKKLKNMPWYFFWKEKKETRFIRHYYRFPCWFFDWYRRFPISVLLLFFVSWRKSALNNTKKQPFVFTRPLNWCRGIHSVLIN